MVPSFAASASVKPWVQAHRPDVDLARDVRDYVDELPLTDETVHRIKALSPKGQPISIAFNRNGKLLADGGASLMLAEKKAHWQQHGAIRDELWQLRMDSEYLDVLPVDALCMSLLTYWSKTSPYPTITVAAGNGTNGCAVKNKSYNTITVGSVDDEGTASRTDDSYAINSCFGNPTMSAYSTTYTDWELPNVVAPGAADSSNAPQVDGYSTGSCDAGTSTASAAVAGVVGQMFEANLTDLDRWPERVRALLMCSADVDTNGVRISLTDQVDDTEGVGEVNATLATQFAASSNKKTTGNTAVARGFDGDGMAATTTPNYNFLAGVYTARASSSSVTSTTKLRVILTWDASAGSSNNCTNTSSAASVACDAQQLDADIDLYVYRHSDGQPMGVASVSATSNWEVVQFGVAEGLQADVDFDIKIYAYQWYNSSTYYGIAWNFGDYPLSN